MILPIQPDILTLSQEDGYWDLRWRWYWDSVSYRDLLTQLNQFDTIAAYRDAAARHPVFFVYDTRAEKRGGIR